jgi:phosphohistidine phosphatase SixA
MVRVSLFCVLAWLCSSCTSYYYVVRHADRLDNSDNSPLSSLGFQRADALRDSLTSKNIHYIFASTFLRTQQTGQPLATLLNQHLRIYNKDTTDGLIKRLKRFNGKKILVTGHSDNVPQIVQGLCGQTVAPIGHDDYDNLYVIKVTRGFGAQKTLWQKTYGRLSP